MRLRPISNGGCLLIFGLIGDAIYTGIYRLITGHFPAYGGYVLWGIIGASILADAEFFLNQISDDTKEIKKQTEKIDALLSRVEDVEKAIHKLELTIIENS
jgi:hypothetical protein